MPAFVNIIYFSLRSFPPLKTQLALRFVFRSLGKEQLRFAESKSGFIPEAAMRKTWVFIIA